MNVNEKNRYLLENNHQGMDFWPKIKEYSESRNPFFFEFDLGQKLPVQPGLIIIRGPRQYGKSTWLELAIQDTVEHFGIGSALYLNGDEIDDVDDLEQQIVNLEKMFPKKAKTKRIFIDEISAVKNWEKAFKRLYDSGHLRDILVVTTGSNARDLRRGSEKLPGRKGKLQQSEYIFPPVSYQQFYKTCYRDLLHINVPPWVLYLYSGGSPLAINELMFDNIMPEFLVTLVKDWIQGDIISLGRDRISFKNIINTIFRFGTSSVGFAKLAKESGLANNTVAAGYIEQLQDLLILRPLLQKDIDKNIFLQKKPCKFLFSNTLAATVLHPNSYRYLSDYKELDSDSRSFLLECLVLQELQRRIYFKKISFDTEIGFWKSEKNEIDFVVDNDLFEVKSGNASPLDFSWFHKTFPKHKLTIINKKNFETDQLKGVTIHDFLMSGPTLDFISEWEDPAEKHQLSERLKTDF